MELTIGYCKLQRNRDRLSIGRCSMNQVRVINSKVLGVLSFCSIVLCSMGMTGCSNTMSDVLNPYAENGGEDYGKRDNSAILGGDSGSNDATNARHALEVMSQYRRTQDPQPQYPVIQPAEVRLMWVPDHINRAGDLVPAHYYFLKVLDDRWEVQDAFDLDRQLGDDSKNIGGATPWVYKK